MPRFPCAHCGEPVPPGRPVCPHCLEPQPEPEAGAPIPHWIAVDLHDDLPDWEEAERRLHAGLAELVRGRTRSLLLVHGYGKGGQAGRGLLKRRLHQRLEEWSAASLEKAWYPGEALAGDAAWASLPPALRRQAKLRDQLQGNPGVTLVLG